MKRVRSKGGMEVKCPRNRVVVRVPATTANMGPGFDALGMGIDIWNEISVERAGSFSIETEGEGVGAIPEEVGPNGESKHTVMVALKRAFEYAGETLPPVRVCCRNRVPVLPVHAGRARRRRGPAPLRHHGHLRHPRRHAVRADSGRLRAAPAGRDHNKILWE